MERTKMTNKILLKRMLAGLALTTALAAPPTAFASSHEEESRRAFNLGHDWDRDSVASDRFSDQSSHVSSSSRRSSSHHSEWDSASQRSSSSSRSSRSPKLTEISDLRRHFSRGNLEITPANFEGLLQFSELHETAFNTYDRGLFVKGWKASLGFDPLMDLLHKFT